MYRVVVCRDCGALWVVGDQPETTTCPRCGTRHRVDGLQAFAETDEAAEARRARAALLADRAGQGDAFAALDDLGALAGQLETTAVSDVEYLEASGLDPEAVAEAGARASAGPPRSSSRRETVLDAVDALESPTEAEVVDYATDRDVPADATVELLDRLVRSGELTESAGRYRRL